MCENHWSPESGKSSQKVLQRGDQNGHPTDGGTQEVNYIPEGDLYRLIVNSKLPAAERFERWMFDDVLPALRKYGGYGEIQLEELIAKTVTVTVTETLKQLMPLMQQQNAVCRNPLKEDTRARRLKQSKIAQLKPELRVIVDDMILSRQYRYIDIQAFLSLHASGICLARPIAPDEEYAVWHIDCDGRGVWGGTCFPSQEEAEQFYANGYKNHCCNGTDGFLCRLARQHRIAEQTDAECAGGRSRNCCLY